MIRKPKQQLLVQVLSGILGTGIVCSASAQVLQLSTLDGSNGFNLNGIDASDRSGISVSDAGDINGDGIADIVIGAYQATVGAMNFAGESYVVFGNSSGFGADLELSDLDGSDGFRLIGTQSNGRSGYSVSRAGDINGDNIDDIIIGAAFESGYSGNSYVVFGSQSGFAANLDLGALDGNNGFRIDGADSLDFSGSSVSNAGDINLDGIDDLIIGASSADPNMQIEAGSSYIVFGSDQGFSPSISLSALNGMNGFRLDGDGMQSRSGTSVSNAGDFNGDGIDDVIIGALFADPDNQQDAGQSYVIFGSDDPFNATMNLIDLDGTNGIQIQGISPLDFSGVSVSEAGDVNGDGIDDIIIGARGASGAGPANSGEAYVIFGSTSPSSPFELSSLNGNNGFQLNGIAEDDIAGNAVGSAGDFNRDGFADVLVGARSANDNTGETYVVFGKAGGFDAMIGLVDLTNGSGLRIQGIEANDLSGFSVSGAGDVNGDGTDDIIIGAFEANPDGRTEAGQSYVIFGQPEAIFSDGFEMIQ